ncbi:MAG: hypothetical protein HFH82_14015 [Lachnospiraceae bacterium]|nr:hypothetical protein [Lachnospiraceae bacterium]
MRISFDLDDTLFVSEENFKTEQALRVAENGKTYGFYVFIVGKQDDAWTDKIIKEIERIRRLKKI